MKSPLIPAVLASLAMVPAAVAQGTRADLAVSQEGDAQAQEMARKGELADAIIAARQTAAARDFDLAFRQSLKGSLLSLSVDRLEAFLNAGGLGNVEAAVREVTGPKVIGDTAADLAFTPVAPCRIVDTRSSAGGLLVAGAPQSFFVRNAGGFATQGGSATDCGIPASATSVEMNYVAVGAAGAGDLRAFAFGGTLPNASVLNYAAVSGLNIANGIAQPVCNPATTTCTKDLTVQADVSNTHLVIDVVGYFNKIDKAQVKSSVVLAQKQFVAAAPTAACTNAGTISVTIVAPAAGRVLVQGLGTVVLNHVAGTGDEVDLFIGSTATDCPSTMYGQFGFADLPTTTPTGTYFFSLPLFRVFDVTAGSNTFFLNSRLFGGTGHTLSHGGLTATFMPN